MFEELILKPGDLIWPGKREPTEREITSIFGSKTIIEIDKSYECICRIITIQMPRIKVEPCWRCVGHIEKVIDLKDYPEWKIVDDDIIAMTTKQDLKFMRIYKQIGVPTRK